MGNVTKTKFEAACEAIDSEFQNADGTLTEFVINWDRKSDHASVNFPNSRWSSKVKKMAEQHPDKVKILHTNTDGSIVAHVPINAVKLSIIQHNTANTDELEEEQMEISNGEDEVEESNKMNNFELFNIDDDNYVVNDSLSEFIISWVRRSRIATVNFPNSRWSSKVKKMANKHPEMVRVLNENNDGTLIAYIPTKAIHMSIIERAITDEQREARAQRLRDYHKNKTQGKESK